MQMRKIEDEFDVIRHVIEIKGKTIIDVGCGTGELVRKLTGEGAQVTGIDSPEMLAKAVKHPPVRNEKYISGTGENLPLKSNIADAVIFFASLHHIPEPDMFFALKEAYRVLKTGGTGVFLEPIGQEGSYFELIRLVEDERDIQRAAFETIKKAHTLGMENKTEEIIYIERSFNDYVNLLNIFVKDETERNTCLQQARKVTKKLCRAAKQTFEDYRFKSICRVNVLQKH
jgi:ubiquinone/menaquinone biosynthesis C-methylase UbiE